MAKVLPILCLLAILFVGFVASILIWIAYPFWLLPNHSQPWQGNLFDGAVESMKWDGERPLNVLFLTWGSRGDHQPNVALGLELARRGHNVSVLALEKYQDLVQQHASDRFHYIPLVDNYIWTLAEELNKGEPADFLPKTVGYVEDTSRELTEQYISAAKSSNADVLIGSHSAMLLIHHITTAQFTKRPLVLMTHDLSLPTIHHSFSMGITRVKDFGKLSNMFNHRIFSIMLGAMLTFNADSVWRQYRNELGLSTPWPFFEFFHPSISADMLIFSTSDATLWKPPIDHPYYWYSTGYFVTKDDSLEPSASDIELEQWIEERQKPILYFGQGSFHHHSQSMMTDILLDTLQELDMDSITLESTVDKTRFVNNSEYPHVKVVKQLNQLSIFPKCSVILHHGGAGTASQCIRSGRPGICMPSMPFQEVWGGQAEDYGAGVLLLPDQLATAWSSGGGGEGKGMNLLTQAVQAALNETVQEKARELGESARNYPGGVSLAADKLEHHMLELWQRSTATNADQRANNEL